MNAELQRRRDILLAKASMVAEAPGADYVPSGHRQAGSKEPTGSASSMFDLIVEQLTAAGDDDAKIERVIFHGEAAVARYQLGPVVHADELGHQETTEERDYRIVHQYAGDPPAMVAAWERCTSAHVVKLRITNGRHPQTGLLVPGRSMLYANRRLREERVADLHAEGNLSLRKIAAEVGISHVQAQRDLNSYRERRDRERRRREEAA